MLKLLNRDNREPRQRRAVAGSGSYGSKCVRKAVTPTQVSHEQRADQDTVGQQTHGLPVGRTVTGTGGRYWDPARDEDSP